MSDELRHYGVVGMKWGVRRGNVDKAYAKASKKLERLDRKVQKREAKYQKRLDKYNKSKFSISPYSTKKQAPKLQKAAYKHERQVRKAAKWYNQMEREFANSNVKLSKEQKAKGENYVKLINSRDEIRVGRMV